MAFEPNVRKTPQPTAGQARASAQAVTPARHRRALCRQRQINSAVYSQRTAAVEQCIVRKCSAAALQCNVLPAHSGRPPRCVQLNLVASSSVPSAYMAGYLTPLWVWRVGQGGESVSFKSTVGLFTGVEASAAAASR